MKNETWKAIVGYEGLYEISNKGRFRSIDRIVKYSNGRLRLHRGKILDAKQDCQEYEGVVLSKNGKTKRFKKSRMLAIHFIPNPNNYEIVNHINGNKKDDSLENLEWCTQSYNNIHAFRMGLKSYNRKKNTNNVGVSLHSGKYEAFVYRNSRNIYLGRFSTENEAIKKIMDYKSVNKITY